MHFVRELEFFHTDHFFGPEISSSRKFSATFQNHGGFVARRMVKRALPFQGGEIDQQTNKTMKNMKTPKFGSGISRFLPMLALSVSLSATAFAAPQPNVAIPLGGKSFGIFVDATGAQKSKNLFASSLPATIVRSNTYKYSLQGTVHGEGILKNYVAPGMPVKALLEKIKLGSSSILIGQVTTTDGTLIKRTTITGNLDSSTGNMRIGVSLTIGAKITPDGEIRLAVTDVKVTSPLAGAIVFDGPRVVDGKTIPGARLAVAAVVPPAT